MDVRVISIGALARHALRSEPPTQRTGHATCSLVRLAGACIVVDPGLPPQALALRLLERAGIEPAAVTHVFLTRFHPDTARGIRLFDHAAWWIGAQERESMGVRLAASLRDLADQARQRAADADDQSGLQRALEQDIAVLSRCQPASDRLAEHGPHRVDLFPLPGVSPGLCGLLVPGGRRTTLIAGDAVATAEHMHQQAVLAPCDDLALAKESFAEALEIADVIIPGRDNVLLRDESAVF